MEVTNGPILQVPSARGLALVRRSQRQLLERISDRAMERSELIAEAARFAEEIRLSEQFFARRLKDLSVLRMLGEEVERAAHGLKYDLKVFRDKLR